MPTRHKVRQGECLASLAARYGIRDWRTIYDDPANDELQELRPNPNVLYPGDIVQIPDPVVPVLSLATGERHTVIVNRPKTLLRLSLYEDRDGETMTGTFFVEVEGVNAPIEVEVGDDGALDVEVPSYATEAVVYTLDDDGTTRTFEQELLIGYVDPANTPSGLRERLVALGIPCKPTANNDERSYERLAPSILLFQQREDLEATGEPDDATLDKVRELYGD